MPFSTYGLNLMADHVADRTIQVRAHSGDPGAAGTASRIGTASVDIASTGWTAASSGNVENSAAAAFGVLFTSGADQDVTWYSLWVGSNFLGREEMSAAVTVSANESFSINAGTIDLTLTTS